MATGGASAIPFWKGTRGEWYVLLQLVLFVVLAIGPRTAPGVPSLSLAFITPVVGAGLMLGGLAWIVAGATRLGRGLTALPYPKRNTTLIATGPYAFVRHPMYCGAIWLAVGWAVWTQGLLTLGYAVLLAILLERKATIEERWLCDTFAEYPGYRRRVRKLIPFVY